jgi:antitoxin component YwqK of YwqJK toxin-antitoxin module
MKRLIILFLFLTNYSYAQIYTENDEKYWFYNFINDSTLKIYFSEIGVPTSKLCADLFRIAKIDRHYLMFTGEVKDYYMDSTMAFDGKINSSGYLDGNCIFYFPNGKIELNSYYKNGMRDSVWTFYYQNGQKRKVLFYELNTARLLEFYQRNGKQTIKEGNGKYEDFLKLGFLTNYETFVKGALKDGYFDGKIILTNSKYGTIDGVEYFENGKFIKGRSIEWEEDIDYNYEPKTTFFEYIPQENMDIYDFSVACPGYSVNPASYKETYTLSDAFYPELIDSIDNHINVKETENQWFIVTFNVNKDKQLNNLQIKSSLKNKKLEDVLKQILLTMNYWTKEGVLNGRIVNFPFYVTIVFETGMLIIPDYHLKKY